MPEPLSADLMIDIVDRSDGPTMRRVLNVDLPSFQKEMKHAHDIQAVA